MASPGGGQLGRSWRRFRRRPAHVQIVSVAVVVVLVAAVLHVRRRTRDHQGRTTATTVPANAVVRTDNGSAGVTAHSINVVFPVVQSRGAGLQLRLRRRRRVLRAVEGDQALRQADQRQRGYPRSEDQPDHRQLRPDRRDGDASTVQGLDRGHPGRLRRPRRGRGLDGRQPAVHHPGRPYPLHRSMDDGDQLDTARCSPYLWWSGPDDAPILQATVDWGLELPTCSASATRWG